MHAKIIGAGVAGLTCAVELAAQGVAVEVIERSARLGVDSCGWCAGGMLAPWCELEADGQPLIASLGREGLAWWRERLPDLACHGTLVVAGARDLPELTRFAQRTGGYRWIERDAIGALEPHLAGRFERALLFEEEAHLDPRTALVRLAERLRELGGTLRLGSDAGGQLLAEAASPPGVWLIDCRGLAAGDVLPQLRGVRGEMLLVQSRDLELRRPVRLLHPRWPLYLVPRGSGNFMLGATMLESDDRGAVTVRSALELLGAAYALHPAFAEARILELGAQVRPAFPDNLPRICRNGRLLRVNGLYRHGFLIAPALAVRVARIVLEDAHFPELSDEDRAERRLA